MKRLLLLLPAFCILHGTFTMPVAHSSVIQLPQTGQTISYTTGDDGDLKAGVPWPTPRFVDNGDQTVTDKLTGMIWTKDANLIKTRDPSFDTDGAVFGDGAVSWQHALDYVKKLNSENYLGHNDWRLPNLLEHKSLLNVSQSLQSTWLSTQGFSNVQSYRYWTSTSSVGGGLYIVTGNGIAYNSESYVWPVRSGSPGAVTIPRSGATVCYNSSRATIDCSGTGQDGDLQSGAAWPSPRFTDNGDGTMTDNLTGLTWTKEANAPGPPSKCGSGFRKAWPEALDYVQCLNTNLWRGKSNWRLPNVNELQSLANAGESKQYTWLESQGFLYVDMGSYWSSTTDVSPNGVALNMAYSLYMLSNFVDSSSKGGVINVWPVSGGQSGAPGTSASLSITNSGSGSGTVTSSPSGINCGLTCNASFTSGQSVTLTATADSGSAFASWTGCDSSSGNQCTVTVNSIKSVSATFGLIPTTACGSANGGSFSAAPAVNLCANGTASTVTTTGTAWNWSCISGTDPPAICSAGIPVDSATSSIQLPQTGQTVCYEPTVDTTPWAEIPCAGTGQDGEIQAGKPWPTPRFTDNSDGTVTDSLTGLNWLKNIHCTDSSGGITKQPVIVNGTPSGWLTWADSLTWSNGLSSGTCGLADGSVAGDWRLPNVAELASLQDASQNSEPALPTGHFFGNAWAQFYQSSTTYALATSKEGQWVGDILHGGIHNWGKSDNVLLWPVRDGGAGVIQLPRTGQTGCWNTAGTAVPCTGTGQDGDKLRGVAWPSPRLIDNLNGTVTDRLTGLIWLKDANCLETSGGIVKSGASLLFESGTLSWPDALTWSRNLGSGVCKLQDGSSAGDWRLPNKNELQSLIDRQNYGPTLPTGHPFLNVGTGVQAKYWSSTPTVTTASVFPRNLVWTTSMLYGAGGPGWINYTDLDGILKMFENFVWPVRGGSFGDSVINVSPSTKDFGSLAVGESANQLLTISNSGATSRLQVSAMALYGADAGQFALSVGDGDNGTCGSTMPIIPPGSSCTVTVSFYPTNTGAKSASLRISASDVNTPNTNISLSGNGLINGTCGTSNGGTFNAAPSSNLCTSGTASTLSGTGPWTWNCNGVGGTSESCSAAVTNFAVSFAAGAHGSLTGTTSQTINYGGTATTVTATPDPTYAFVNWTEGATVVGTNATLTISNVTSAHSYTANFIVNYGVCGTSNGGSFPTAPASNLCIAGTATVLSGTGPWSWQCVSAYGGATANCSANIRTYTVTPSAGTSFVISPATPVTVNHGAQVTFTIAAPEGYGITGTGCGGTLSGTTYTSGVVTADCTVNINTVRRTADAAGAGQPTLQDAMKAFHAYNGKLQLSAAEKILYDVAPLGSNGIPVGNSVVDYADIIMIMRRIVGIGSW